MVQVSSYGLVREKKQLVPCEITEECVVSFPSCLFLFLFLFLSFFFLLLSCLLSSSLLLPLPLLFSFNLPFLFPPPPFLENTVKFCSVLKCY